MTLYELTRKLVARGCPEHESVFYQAPDEDPPHGWHIVGLWDSALINEVDATDLWTAHALRWWRTLRLGQQIVLDDRYDCDFINAIEAATRHLEPTNAKA